MVPFEGHFFDAAELVRLVDASLDFWLTTGRYALEFETKFASYREQTSGRRFLKINRQLTK